jgi:hypothetical protein
VNVVLSDELPLSWTWTEPPVGIDLGQFQFDRTRGERVRERAEADWSGGLDNQGLSRVGPHTNGAGDRHDRPYGDLLGRVPGTYQNDGEGGGSAPPGRN